MGRVSRRKEAKDIIGTKVDIGSSRKGSARIRGVVMVDVMIFCGIVPHK